MNLERIGGPRRRPATGDLFVFRVHGEFLFGRVVGANLPLSEAPMPGAHLLYIYAVRSDSPSAPSTLDPHDLLIPPVFTNSMPWTKGYFRSIGTAPLEPSDLLPRLCFWDALLRRYRDQTGRAAESVGAQCGSWGLVSYRGLDDQISHALGIPRAPLQPGDIE